MGVGPSCTHACSSTCEKTCRNPISAQNRNSVVVNASGAHGAFASSASRPGYSTVDLCVSHFPGAKDWMLAGQQVFHTSVVVGNKEYYFNPEGVQAGDVHERYGVPPSHVGKDNTLSFEVGQTRRTGEELVACLSRFFRRGCYDIIHCNCNAFTDCALALLLSRRLPKTYSALDKVAQQMPSLLKIASGGRYRANEKARDFDLESVVLCVDPNAWMGTAEAVYSFKDAPVNGVCQPVAIKRFTTHEVTRM